MSSLADTQNLNAITADWYNANPNLEDGRLRAHRIEFHVTLPTILARLPDRPGCKILDVGGGTGSVPADLLSKYMRARPYAIADNSPTTIHLASKRATICLNTRPAIFF